MYKWLFLIWLMIGFVSAVNAQKPDTTVKSKSESLKQKSDSAISKPYTPKITKEKTYHPDTLHDPHKALMHSLIIPGWGQIYNHAWYKVPVIYAGMALLVDAIIFNQHYYNIFLTEAKLRQQGISNTPGVNNPLLINVSDADVTNYTDLYRRNRDLCILGMMGAWGIQMIEAYVNAKFIRSYTMDNNLSFKISPGVIDRSAYAFSSNNSYIPAIKITFTLK